MPGIKFQQHVCTEGFYATTMTRTTNYNGHGRYAETTVFILEERKTDAIIYICNLEYFITLFKSLSNGLTSSKSILLYAIHKLCLKAKILLEHGDKEKDIEKDIHPFDVAQIFKRKNGYLMNSDLSLIW